MPAVVGAEDFEAALGDLQDHLPSWWRTQDPSSQVYLLLVAGAALQDAISVLWETPHLDAILNSASETGLQRNFAFAWGLQREQLPPISTQLAAYIAARVAEDGSVGSLVTTLTSLVNTPVNTTGGPVLTFAAGGGGLTFPSNGSGLITYEFPVGSQPVAGLIFPVNGTGLKFPTDPLAIASDNTIVADGTLPIGSGPGLTFAQNGFIAIIQGFTTRTITVQVQSWLAFDRAAFARAVARFQPADCLPAVIQEVTSYH